MTLPHRRHQGTSERGWQEVVEGVERVARRQENASPVVAIMTRTGQRYRLGSVARGMSSSRRPEISPSRRCRKRPMIAVQAGSRLYTDSASSYRALTGYEHAYVNHTKKEYARGDVHRIEPSVCFVIQALPAGVSWHQQEPICRVMSGSFSSCETFASRTHSNRAELILQAP